VIYILSIYTLIYLILCMAWPTYQVWKRAGVNPIVFGNTDNVYDFIGRAMKVLIALLSVTVCVAMFLPEYYHLLNPISFLDHAYSDYFGGFLLFFSFVWTFIAQCQMRDSWRIGIDHNHKTELVALGLFKVSRNPIFLGMIVTMIGYFLVLPNSITLLILGMGYTLIQIQVRLEEEYLGKNHGKDYISFCNNVRRWF